MPDVTYAHIALMCNDAQKTVDFYQGILGLEMTVADRVEEYAGRPCLYLHLFFKLSDGSYIAFFDAPDFPAPKKDPAQPKFAPHYAYIMPDSAQVDAMKARLEKAGITVEGPHVREPYHSIYFTDPSGHRMELTAFVPTTSERYKEDTGKSAEVLRRWNVEKAERARAAARA
ncbi:MAG: VOC family protein [Betaproteobacteria bacterium]|nr:VOC family protein [Betaproteobacteria bacterium]